MAGTRHPDRGQPPLTALTKPILDGVRLLAIRCDAHVVVVGGPPGLTDKATARVAGSCRPLTLDLVRRAVGAWRATAGRFDQRVEPSSPDAVPGATRSAGCDGIVVDPGRSTVMRPSGGQRQQLS